MSGREVERVKQDTTRKRIVWEYHVCLVLRITFTAFSTSVLAVFSLSGLIAGRLGTLRRNLPSTGATVDRNTETNRLIKCQYKVKLGAHACACIRICRCLFTYMAFVACYFDIVLSSAERF